MLTTCGQDSKGDVGENAVLQERRTGMTVSSLAMMTLLTRMMTASTMVGCDGDDGNNGNG